LVEDLVGELPGMVHPGELEDDQAEHGEGRTNEQGEGLVIFDSHGAKKRRIPRLWPDNNKCITSA
jgi:hypothetical protein